MQTARDAGPSTATEGAELTPQLLGSEAKYLTKHFLTFRVDCAESFPDYGAEEKISPDEAFVVFPMFLASGILLAGFR